MFGRRRRQRAFEQGRVDGMRKQRDDALRLLGQRVGEDTEPCELKPDEREAYWAGRQSAAGGR